jgi:SP family general alpha glucoside:H+ symporter-like MFS transporter
MATSIHSHEEGPAPKVSINAELTANARRATEKEHQMTLMEGIRLYPKAVFWSMLISTCIVMEGECGVALGSYSPFSWDRADC